MVKAKAIMRDLIYIFINYFVNYIPCWYIRKIIYKLFGMKIGKGTRINMKCIIMSPWKIEIGNSTMVNEFVLLDGRGHLKIGNSCSVSMWSILYTASHKSYSATFEYTTAPVKVGDCCWLGTRSVIMPGSDIKDRTILSVNSVWKGETCEGGIYTGNPASLLKMRAVEENYEQDIVSFFK